MALDYDFCADMDARKQAAMDRRNRGRATGKPAKGWNARAQLREAQNDNARAALDYGAEFDKLVGRSLPAPPLPPQTLATPARTRGDHAMTNKQYLDALKKLGLTPSGKATARALGLSLRQCQRIAAGDCEVPETVALLLRMYLEHGIPVGAGAKSSRP